nr:hypothetical protein [Tanacetum cinerariifolium]
DFKMGKKKGADYIHLTIALWRGEYLKVAAMLEVLEKPQEQV